MAHAATIGELTEGLIGSITGIPRDHSLFGSLKDRAVKQLKDSSRGRTNPFEVNERFAGLIEKFGVLNRDDLGEALESRLDSLPKTRWTPEFLSLLLQLTDRPWEHPRIENLGQLRTSSTQPAEPTWEEIVADDPLTEDDISNDVERGYHSSGDDVAVDDDSNSEPTTSTQATSCNEEDFAGLARLHIVQPDATLLSEVQSARQALSKHGTSNRMDVQSELTIIREALSMLRGLPTYIFDLDPLNNAVGITQRITTATASSIVIHDVLVQLAEVGTRLNSVRQWLCRKQSRAHLQSVQAAVQQSMTLLDSRFVDLERRYAQPQYDYIVSFVDVRREVEASARPMIRLSDIIASDASASVVGRSPFALLDLLYEESCVAQLEGDEDLFAVVARVLLAGLRTYLRPISGWYFSGTPPSKDGEDFFVREMKTDCDLGEVWHERFALRLLPDGRVCAPGMMQPFVEQLYRLGKSRAFIKLLGQQSEDETAKSIGDLAMPDFTSITRYLESSPLTPFDELLHATLTDWMATLIPTTDLSMQTLLLDGLLRTVNALDYIFLGRDGTLLQAFAEALFECMRRLPETWDDRFLLTRMAQSTLGTAPAVDAHCINVGITNGSKVFTRRPLLQQLDRVQLTYAIPWPVQNVTRSKDLPTHTAAFSLLLQVELAAHLLRPQLFDIRKLEIGCRRLARGLQMALSLRTRLLWFLGTLRAHIATTAATLGHALRVRLQSAEGIDAMGGIWANHDKRLKISLLLSPSLTPIRDAIAGMLQLCESLADSWPLLLNGATSPEAVMGMSEDFNKSLSFVSAGLRGVSRAGGEAMLEALGESLRCSVG
ncbi:hypothetical protein LTR91_005064 [Friedmanniomyces endolithicus]|uniref:Spindle pole body component n=1 Tax=Friedmanniomyces endolithicus TaxID=329885 RepID=A0AAN6QXC0_9PEZI|nr:hypothetical protein LTR59_016480 [Friedmanniomyces endolithicus]KAK0814084.1 hypothetical protein LTR38_002859 [Friedmanniomyces endolithicus]KAK0820607.1 hypothetical protein LTR75_001485 [Friedmanniomyces endolithicus]KAK0850514.1 hypothetical protein LTS02_013143 [Friedmanniomyces endolithicus]KAK0857909.1 hypothetical protein LTR03_000475 [Friedmanniomyces endolithicus]